MKPLVFDRYRPMYPGHDMVSFHYSIEFDKQETVFDFFSADGHWIDRYYYTKLLDDMYRIKRLTLKHLA